MQIIGNTKETTISTSSEYKIVDGGIWEEVKTSNMEFDSNKLVVENTGDFMITVSLSASIEEVDKEFEFIVANNGDVISHSRLKSFFNNLETQTVGLNSLANLEEGDEISVKVKNNTDTTNIVIEDAILRAVRV